MSSDIASISFTEQSRFYQPWNLSLFGCCNSPVARLLGSNVSYCFQSISSRWSDIGREIIPCRLTELDLCTVISALFFFLFFQHSCQINTENGPCYICNLFIFGCRVSTPLYHHGALCLHHVFHDNYQLAIWNSLGWKKKNPSCLSLMSDLLIYVSVHHLLQQNVSRALAVGQDLPFRNGTPFEQIPSIM